MPFPLKTFISCLCVVACSTPADAPFDALFDQPDARVDASMWDAGSVRDAGVQDVQEREQASCFSQPLLIAQASSRLGVGGILALENGWLVSYFGGEDSRATFVDATGRIFARPNAHFRSSTLALGHESFAQVAGHEVRRFTWTGEELRVFEPVLIGIAWGSILTTDADVDEGRIRVLSYDPVEHVGDLRLRVTQLDVDDSSDTGFSVRTGALGASFTDELPARLAYQQYVLEGDWLRVVGPSVSAYGGPYQTILAQLELDSLADNEDLPYRIQERFSLGEAEEPGAMLMGELHRMARHETSEDGRRHVVVEAFPQHEGATGELGEGAYQPIDESIFAILGDQGELQIVRDSDLGVLARTQMEGAFAGAARLDEAVAFLTKRRNSMGTVLLEMRCVTLR